MVNKPGEHESTEISNSSETIEQPDINFLLEGTWSYIIDIYEKDRNNQQAPLSAIETQEKINSALMKVNKQGGQLIKILEMEVKGEKSSGMMGIPPEQKVFMFVVNKEKENYWPSSE